MQRLKKLNNLIHLVFLIVMKMSFLYPSSASEETPAVRYYSCGGIIVKPPFLHNNKENSSLLLICKSDKLYFRTTLGGLLLQVSSIDYTHKHLTISHTSSSFSNNKSNYNINVRGLVEEQLGTRISFDIPDHVPNPCNECEKPYGNCGVGLRCVCHPKQCRDKVISGGAVMKPCSDVLLVLFVVLGFFRGF
ncbi:hypothetical protein ABFX02_14G239000 [Erythranthe guttata]